MLTDEHTALTAVADIVSHFPSSYKRKVYTVSDHRIVYLLHDHALIVINKCFNTIFEYNDPSILEVCKLKLIESLQASSDFRNIAIDFTRYDSYLGYYRRLRPMHSGDQDNMLAVRDTELLSTFLNNLKKILAS